MVEFKKNTQYRKIMYSIKTTEQPHKINIGICDNAEYQIYYPFSSHCLPCKSDQIVFIPNLI